MKVAAANLPKEMVNVGAALVNLVSNPNVLAATAGVLGLWGILHFVGVGEVIDAALISAAAYVLPALNIMAAFNFGWSFGKMLYGIYNATCYNDLQRVAVDFANGIANGADLCYNRVK